MKASSCGTKTGCLFAARKSEGHQQPFRWELAFRTLASSCPERPVTEVFADAPKPFASGLWNDKGCWT